MPGCSGLTISTLRSMVQPGLTGSTGIRSAAQSRSPPLNRKQQPSGQLSSPIFCTRHVLVNLCQANALMQTWWDTRNIQSLYTTHFLSANWEYRKSSRICRSKKIAQCKWSLEKKPNKNSQTSVQQWLHLLRCSLTTLIIALTGVKNCMLSHSYIS